MKILWLNPIAAQWCGPQERLVGTYCYESFQGRDDICPGCPSAKAFQTGKLETGEEVNAQNGKICRNVATPIKNEQGEVIQVLKLIMDITSEKQIIQTLKESEGKYQTLTENMPEMLYIADPKQDFAYSYVSKAIEDIYGYSTSEGECIKKPGFWASHIYRPDRKRVLSEVHQAFREGKDGVLEYRITDKEKKINWVQNRLHWLKDEQGRILCLQGLLLSIDQRKANESKLHFFSSMLESVTEAVFMVNYQTGLTEYVNGAACRLFNCEQNDLIGKSPDIFLHQDNPPEVLRQIMEATFKGGWEGELKNIRRDGTIFDLFLKTTLLRDEFGEPWMYFGTHRDISKEKQLKEQLVHSERMSAIGRLAGWVAHEFNNLHAIIQGHIDILFLQGGISVQIRENLETIRAASKKATVITRQLLTFTRRQAAKKVYAKLAAVIEDTVRMLKKELTTQGVQLEIVHYQPVTVFIDPVQIGQVAINLIINAQQAMGGAQQKNLRLETGKMGDKAFFRIADTCCGIRLEKLKTIFEPYYTTKEEHKGKGPGGTGLGLAISHTIIEDHGGDIDVESVPGQGAVFTVWLPVEKKAPGAEEAPEAETWINLQGIKVLVIEDERDIQSIIQRALIMQGAEVQVAERGKAGLRQIKSEKYDVALVDLQIPDMQGEELLRLIHEIPKEQRPAQLIITGKATIEDVREFKKWDVVDILFKPFELEELFAAVKAEVSQAKRPHKLVGHS